MNLAPGPSPRGNLPFLLGFDAAPGSCPSSWRQATAPHRGRPLRSHHDSTTVRVSVGRLHMESLNVYWSQLEKSLDGAAACGSTPTPESVTRPSAWPTWWRSSSRCRWPRTWSRRSPPGARPRCRRPATSRSRSRCCCGSPAPGSTRSMPSAPAPACARWSASAAPWAPWPWPSSPAPPSIRASAPTTGCWSATCWSSSPW